MNLRIVVVALAALGLVGAVPAPIVTHVTVVGDPVVSVASLVSHLAVRPGIRYSDTVREEDAVAARKFYEAHHLQLAVIEGGIDPGSVDAKTNTAAVKYTVYPARVVAVDVNGAANVADVAPLLHVLPGMLLNSELIKADERRLRATGKFSKVNVDIKPGPYPNKPQDVTLSWVLAR